MVLRVSMIKPGTMLDSHGAGGSRIYNSNGQTSVFDPSI